MTEFSSILVANRGEIAIRILRTARALGYRTVAVYSDADRDAPHVRFADEAHRIGPAPAPDSYLNIGRIVEAAQNCGAGAVHPGYGFLSENADFARACAKTGLTFIGPSADTIEHMGNKAHAKRLMGAAGVPCIPGYQGEDQSDACFIREAARVGFPLMVKAAAGGGGRGMRLVDAPDALADALKLARAEAQNAFGSGELILEKAIVDARHVEIQIFGDRHGTIVHFGERDCSLQRRHQKVIEEAPSPAVDPDLRARMGKAATDAARSVDYVGAGTVEFLLDGNGEFHFLEMNTRIQVEHPVSEAVTGHDFVALQIAVASGAPLGLEQDDIDLIGHAIEARLYAEDPANGFLPASGTVDFWRPAEADDVRIDAGIATGTDVSAHYDPMLAKIIAWGSDRDEARRKLTRALNETVLFGPRNNRAFLVAALQNPVFAAGQATTVFIDAEFPAGMPQPEAEFRHAALAAITLYRSDRDVAHARSVSVSTALLDWSSSGALHSGFCLFSQERRFSVSLRVAGPDRFDVVCGDDRARIEIRSTEAGGMIADIDGRAHRIAKALVSGRSVWLAVDDGTYHFLEASNATTAPDVISDGSRILAPMHGNLVEICVEPGAAVAAGNKLAVLEAMKMQHEVTAAIAGLVEKVHYGPGSQVAAGDLLFEISPQEQPRED